MASSSAASNLTGKKPWIVGDRPFAFLLLITSFVSFLAAAALVLDRLELYKNANAVLTCDFNAFVSCGKVMEQPQAALFGFPNPFIGIVCFGIVFAVGMSMLAGAKFARWYWVCFQIGVTLGMIFICWLWFQALYVIAILCPWCMVVWAMMIPLFVWTTIRNLVHGVIPAPAGLVKFLSNWGWTIVVLVYLGVIASIFFRFVNLFFTSNA
ncbi:vitamin K epoxide reductase family protein [Psychromicrobium lacuslunae]|uniref:Membrane protein n=1 Tax=Psychromicrobium lacuslunae TaxID=1618207 RepID=A0A0D4BXG0_9MICC|nr:vitamin K epoxide reductase family protein [Psychromicrobium lacuslunae]AJT41137.1 membrane protein [Psychromicrobium lacuslunae]